MNNEYFQRAELLLGAEYMERLACTRVILFGVGGVGSWCAEALIRSGLGSLTIVDMDTVAPSNINRQLPATSLTIGQPKVEAMRRRLLEINPDAKITAIAQRFTAENADDFNLNSYDFVVDAIDSVADKAELILRATASTARLFSSMGAARKLDPGRIQVKEFWQVKGCPLAAALRSRFKRLDRFPRRKFRCVFSDEVLPAPPSGPNGSLVTITATWGMMLASLIVQKLQK
ncbi:MAG: tRNA threonylcarbamoyladenosine dehydratase [Bacteroides sp.]|nr:tRNA threonylcarbamoyladenosine dehydratase [Bacteroides sp.]MCM1378874.1 tRNA threonylcarbamoyladenosine dehydratase [Bacteroides sp.]MCM1445490.1 tRNA threonylcarbamoyladenosine dehydratase [Prevotella sp.]